MFNTQYAAGNQTNMDNFTALRLTLIKLVLRYLALMLNFSKNTGAAADEKFLSASVEFLGYERDNRHINLVNKIVNVDLSSNYE